jgi:V8-like Glu-specific endopeptidase
MTKSGWPFIFPGLVAFAVFAPIAVAGIPGIWRSAHGLIKDNRVVKGRLHPGNNRDHEDDSFLNAVGAVWSADIKMSAVGYSASTGFLIDPCHVLTNMHVVYTDDIVINPSIGKSVDFAVGQTEGEGDSGALQGLRFLLIGAVDGAHLPKNRRLAMAGFPADLRERRGDRLDLKDLWESDGYVVGIVWAGTAGAVVESTIQASLGSSGGPLYGEFYGQKHMVIGMAQGIRGNGVDVSESSPNVQVLFTPDTLARIRDAQLATTCQ